MRAYICFAIPCIEYLIPVHSSGGTEIRSWVFSSWAWIYQNYSDDDRAFGLRPDGESSATLLCTSRGLAGSK
jgi:hypothetical protein